MRNIRVRVQEISYNWHMDTLEDGAYKEQMHLESNTVKELVDLPKQR